MLRRRPCREVGAAFPNELQRQIRPKAIDLGQVEIVEMGDAETGEIDLVAGRKADDGIVPTGEIERELG